MSQNSDTVDNQLFREIVTYGWFILIGLSMVATAFWLTGWLPDRIGLYAAGWFSASAVSIISMLLSSVLRR